MEKEEKYKLYKNLLDTMNGKKILFSKKTKEKINVNKDNIIFIYSALIDINDPDYYEFINVN